jgi:hypothetical protein
MAGTELIIAIRMCYGNVFLCLGSECQRPCGAVRCDRLVSMCECGSQLRWLLGHVGGETKINTKDCWVRHEGDVQPTESHWLARWALWQFNFNFL